MASYTYTGTVTIDAVPYDASGEVTVDGDSLLGSVTLGGSASRFMPISWHVVGLEFESGAFAFSPDTGDLVQCSSILLGSTAITGDLEQLTATGVSVDLNFAGTTMDISLSRTVAASADPVDQFEELFSGRRAISQSAISINELAGELEHLGTMVSLRRNPRERSASYINRIMRVRHNQTNSGKESLIGAIDNELGLSQGVGIIISISPTATYSSYELRFMLDNARLRLMYQATPEGEFELEAEAWLADYTIGQLAGWINANSTEFVAQAQPGWEDRTSLDLYQTDSWRHRTEIYNSQEVLRISSNAVVPGSVVLSNATLFSREVDHSSVANYGEWGVDYENGLMKSYSADGSEIVVGLLESRKRVDVIASEVRVFDLSESDDRASFFDQIAATKYSDIEGRYIEGLPNDDGYALLRRVMNFGQGHHWGK